MRDDFSKQNKRILGDRVAWKCSFPGCSEITVGPGNKDESHVLKLGVAAHITAASPGGPRYDPTLTNEERSSLKNAIWLCNKHGDLIDKDFTEYSEETLRQWKAQAEEKAHKNLLSNRDADNYLTTLISIGASIICDAEWNSIKSNIWTFTIKNFIIGNKNLLFDYCMNFESTSVFDKYLIFERQGDGRLLEKVELSNEAGNLEISFTVKSKYPCQDPNKVGGDIALGEDGDISFADNDLAMVYGIDAARQAVHLTLSSTFGDWKENPLVGSYFNHYYNQYKQNHHLLERLLKLEITRLLSIPIHGGYPPSFAPLLPFIKRVLSIEVYEESNERRQVPILVRGEWGNGEIFEELFKIYIHRND